jgi:hypothetical protein
LPTFSIISTECGDGASRSSARVDHLGVEVAALAGVDLQRRRAGGADAVGVDAGLLVAFDHRHRQPAGEQLDGAHQQRGLARAGAGDEVQREDAALRQSRRLRCAAPSFLARMSRSICTSRACVMPGAEVPAAPVP